MHIITLIFNILFPPTCILCGRLGSQVCDKCKNGMQRCDFPLCIICENIAIKGETHKYCFSQGVNLPDFYHYSYAYESCAKKIINKAKGETGAYRILDHLLYSIDYEELRGYHLIIPIPPSLSSNRLQDIVLYMAQTFSKKLQIPFYRVLKQNTYFTQKTLDRIGRFENALNKFSLNPKAIKHISGRKVLLIDDVSTTGASLLNAAKVLKDNGALKVGCYALFKDLRYNSINA